MHVRALGIHVEDAVVGAVIDHPGARPPFAPPDAAVGRSGARFGLTQSAFVRHASKAIGVADTTIDAARFDGTAIGRQIVEAQPEPRIDVFLQHIRTRVDMGVGIIDTEAFPHFPSPLRLSTSTPGRLI